jgi:hypothetical protein
VYGKEGTLFIDMVSELLYIIIRNK